MRKNDMNEIRNKAKLYRKASAEDILGKESDVTLAKGKLNLSKRRKLSS
jgi:hypothetical protein